MYVSSKTVFFSSVICSPSPPTASAIIQLEGLTGDAGKETFRLEYGWDGQVKLHEVLWQCQSLMAGVKGKVASRRILLLTCNADPHNGDQSLNIQVSKYISSCLKQNLCRQKIILLCKYSFGIRY